MAKSFTEHERGIIRDKLIESCKECWNKYGYGKTNVKELCRMSGISTGAFYQFFESKEVLFAETAQILASDLSGLVEDHLRENPGKYGLAEGFKAAVHRMDGMNWYTSMIDEWQIILRKLPPDFMDKTRRVDDAAFSDLAQKYGLRLKKGVDDTITILELATVGIIHKNKIKGDTSAAIDFIIDAVIGVLFE